MTDHSIKKRLLKKVLATLAVLAVAVVAANLKAEELPLGFDKNSVQFIFAKAGTNYNPSGTCFVVSVPVYFKMPWWKRVAGHVLPISVSTGVTFPYIVTAKHVLLDANDQVRPDLYLRVSRVGGGVTYTSLTEGPANHLRVMTNPDKSIDIAVFTISNEDVTNMVRAVQQKTIVRELKAGSISSKVLKDQKFFERSPVREGDDIFFVGLFTPFYGAQANIPICRFGRISMVTSEKIPFLGTYGTNMPQDLYVAETQVFGGNSGSPAFVYKKNKTPSIFTIGPPNQLQNDVYLAGVIKGYFNDWSEVKVVNSGVTPISSSSFGVAVIVPAYHLYEILFSADEKRLRANFEKLFHQKK